MAISYYECSICKRHYTPDEVTYCCPRDGGNLTVHSDFEEHPVLVDAQSILADREPSIWRYAPLLPVNDPGFCDTPLHQVGLTPLYRPIQLAESLGMENLWIKDESRNPSASFKDRASAIVVARAIDTKQNKIVAASTGNAGAAMACMCAAARKEAIILAPRTAPPAKLAQLTTYGAKVILVDGNYDQAFDLSIEASKEFGWYNRNTGYNPFTTEGKKTAAYEIWEQLLRVQTKGSQRVTIFIPVGDGNILTGIWKGFSDLIALGWIEEFPKLIGVQAEGSAAIADAWMKDTEIIKPVEAHTLADSISVDLPRDGLRALQAVKQTGGYFIKVTDEEILQAIATLGKCGIFVEPAAAAAFAGMNKARNNRKLNRNTPTLVLCTGSGLKDVKAASLASRPALIIEPSLEALKKVVHG